MGESDTRREILKTIKLEDDRAAIIAGSYKILQMIMVVERLNNNLGKVLEINAANKTKATIIKQETSTISYIEVDGDEG